MEKSTKQKKVLDEPLGLSDMNALMHLCEHLITILYVARPTCCCCDTDVKWDEALWVKGASPWAWHEGCFHSDILQALLVGGVRHSEKCVPEL